MRLPSTVEDHLRTIHRLESGPGRAATVAGIARELGLSTSVVSETVGRLRRDGSVAPRDGGGVRLTPVGRERALRVVRAHRLVETFLHRELGLELHELHAEADRLEHAVSDDVADRLDALLGHPEHDPHGDPIPRPGRGHEETWPTALRDAPDGSTFLVERVVDREDAALERLAAVGILPRTRVRVGQHDPFGGGLELELEGRALRLAPGLVRAVHGSVVAEPEPAP